LCDIVRLRMSCVCEWRTDGADDENVYAAHEPHLVAVPAARGGDDVRHPGRARFSCRHESGCLAAQVTLSDPASCVTKG
jgi:hypothetical protein